jgi:hypothetical protein
MATLKKIVTQRVKDGFYICFCFFFMFSQPLNINLQEFKGLI